MRPEVIAAILGTELVDETPDFDKLIDSADSIAFASGTEARVIAMIASRQEVGLRKYGITVEENPLSLREWLQHQLEELLDAAIYCQRAIEQIDKKADDFR